MNERNWTVGQKLAGAFAVAALTLTIIAGFGYMSTARLIDNNHRVEQSHEVRLSLSEMLLVMVDAETGQRGFVVTGDEAFLEPYRSAIAVVDQSFARLRKLTADNPAQQQRLDLARPLIDKKLTELDYAIGLRRAKGFTVAAGYLAKGAGKQTMDQLRRVFSEMDQEESDLLERRGAEAESSARGAKAMILYGSLLGIAFIVVMGWLISRSLSREIGLAVGHIQSSSVELQAAVSQQSSGSREQATSMAEISTTVSELLAASRQIAESARRVSEISGETSQAAGAGDQTVLRADESVAAIRRQVDLIVGHMLDLGKKSQRIGGILEIITELAEQTNILSINASVEAAGAGEAGRRFGVVADEIRKLAERVAGSTKEIRDLVEEVRAAVNTTVMATEGGAKAAEAGTRQFGELTASFKGIVQSVEKSAEAAREIELSTKQQALAVEQVNVAITGITQTTRESEASSNQTLQTSRELTQLSKALSRLVQAEARA
jgi:CHASE3 domain sensor protein